MGMRYGNYLHRDIIRNIDQTFGDQEFDIRSAKNAGLPVYPNMLRALHNNGSLIRRRNPAAHSSSCHVNYIYRINPEIRRPPVGR